jgi:hypothetical protein
MNLSLFVVIAAFSVGCGGAVEASGVDSQSGVESQPQIEVPATTDAGCGIHETLHLGPCAGTILDASAAGGWPQTCWACPKGSAYIDTVPAYGVFCADFQTGTEYGVAKQVW